MEVLYFTKKHLLQTATHPCSLTKQLITQLKQKKGSSGYSLNKTSQASTIGLTPTDQAFRCDSISGLRHVTSSKVNKYPMRLQTCI